MTNFEDITREEACERTGLNKYQLSWIEIYSINNFLNQGAEFKECPHCHDVYIYYPYGIEYECCDDPECVAKQEAIDTAQEEERRKEKEIIKVENKKSLVVEPNKPKKRKRDLIREKINIDPKWGNIYLIGSQEGLYKIGLTTGDVGKRVFDIQNMSPTPIFLIHSFQSHYVRKMEFNLHNKFRICRRHGEWFELNSNELEWIKSINDFELDEILNEPRADAQI